LCFKDKPFFGYSLLIEFCAGIASLLLGAVVTATPWITELWLLVIVVLIGGIVFGYLDAGE